MVLTGLFHGFGQRVSNGGVAKCFHGKKLNNAHVRKYVQYKCMYDKALVRTQTTPRFACAVQLNRQV